MPINYKKLLAQILSDQQEGASVVIDEKRIIELAKGLSKPNLNEQAILLRSPKTRRQILEKRKAYFSSYTDSIRKQYDLTILPLAASSKSDSTILKNESMSVCFYTNDSNSDVIIQLILESDLFKELPADINIRLVDSDGLEWLAGKPDENGELVSIWKNQDIDLIDRLSQYKLKLDFY